MELIAHRGASAYAVENSIQAVKLALEMGSSAVEVDVHLSLDNIIIVHHDSLVIGLNGKPVIFKDKSYDEIKSLVKLANGEEVPALSRILEIMDRKSKLYIEIKQPGLAPHLVGLLEKEQYFENIAVTSSILDEISFVKKNYPVLPVSLVLNEISPEEFENIYNYMGNLGIYEVSISINAIKSNLAKFAKNDNFIIRVYTVNDKKEAEFLNGLGVDSVFTDMPDLMGTIEKV